MERALLLQIERLHLKRLPTRGKLVVQGPGENAGIVDIGDGLVAAFKIESHNHPSYVEPFQGAATGVGGILRDIFTMGARPIAVLDSLRFGDCPRRTPREDAARTGAFWKAWCAGSRTTEIVSACPRSAAKCVFEPCYAQSAGECVRARRCPQGRDFSAPRRRASATR